MKYIKFLALIPLLSFEIIYAQLPNFEPFTIGNDENETIPAIPTEQVSGTASTTASSLHRFYLLTATTINTTEDFASSITGAQRFAAKWVLKPYVYGSNKQSDSLGLDLCVSMNAINLRPSGVVKDSIDLIGLMFPGPGNSGFIIGPQLTWKNFKKSRIQHSLVTELTFSLRQSNIENILIKSDTLETTMTESISFSVLNYNIMPMKYTFSYSASDNFSTWISIGPYINIFNIPDEDAMNFNKLFDSSPIFIHPDKKSNIVSLGVKVSGGIEGFEFYVDLRNNFAEIDVSNENVYKGFIFNFGFSTTLQLLSR